MNTEPRYASAAAAWARNVADVAVLIVGAALVLGWGGLGIFGSTALLISGNWLGAPAAFLWACLTFGTLRHLDRPCRYRRDSPP